MEQEYPVSYMLDKMSNLFILQEEYYMQIISQIYYPQRCFRYTHFLPWSALLPGFVSCSWAPEVWKGAANRDKKRKKKKKEKNHVIEARPPDLSGILQWRFV